MIRNRRTKVVFPIFSNYEVRVILARDVTKTCRRLREDVTDARAAFVYDIEGRPGIGWLVFPLDPDEGTIAHEASHAVQQLFKWAGARRDEETFAYHLDYLVQRIHKFIKKGQRKCGPTAKAPESCSTPPASVLPVATPGTGTE